MNSPDCTPAGMESSKFPSMLSLDSTMWSHTFTVSRYCHPSYLSIHFLRLSPDTLCYYMAAPRSSKSSEINSVTVQLLALACWLYYKFVLLFQTLLVLNQRSSPIQQSHLKLLFEANVFY